MSQVFRITVGTLVLAPIVAAYLLIGSAAHAATTDTISLRDPRVSSHIDKTVKGNCRGETPGSVEHSICVAEGRKNAYRAAADARRGEKQDASFSLK